MTLFELLKKTISKMPNGWGETVQVNLTGGWTAPCDGILTLSARGSGVAYLARKGVNEVYMGVYAFGGGTLTSSSIAKKGTPYIVSYKGPDIKETVVYFTPFSYRGGYFYRLVKRLQSLFLKGVMA